MHDKKGKFTLNRERLWLLTHCAFEGWSIFKVMKRSMLWYLDENCWEAGQQQFVNQTHISFFSFESTACFAC